MIKDKKDFEKRLRKVEKTLFYKSLRFLHYDFLMVSFPLLVLIGYLKNIPMLTRIPFYVISLIVLHWLFLKNECCLNYILKKWMYKDYTLGDNPAITPDIYFNKSYHLIFDGVVMLTMLLIFFLFVKDKTLFEYQLVIVAVFFLCISRYANDFYCLHFDCFGNQIKEIKYSSIFEKILFTTVVSENVLKNKPYFISSNGKKNKK